jgi:flagella basal body P-ring formation protein FlgA
MIKLMEAPQLREGAPVYLMDIAEVSGGEERIQDQLGRLMVATSTHELKSGNTLLLQLRSQINEFKKQCNCQVQLQVPRHFSLVTGTNKRPGKTFSENKLTAEIISRAKTQCTECRVEVEALRCTAGAIPENYSTWEVNASINKAGGDSLVQVYFGDVTKPVDYLAKVKILAPALKLKAMAPLGASIEEAMVDVDWLPPSPIRTMASYADIATSELKRSLAKGQIIYIDDLRERHIVRAGRIIKVEIVKGVISVETTGTPAKDAKMGDFIPVRLSKTNKNVTAEVIGPGKVRIQ